MKDRLLRYRIFEAHAQCIRKGQYSEARKILRMLNEGKIVLRLDDTSWAVQAMLEAIGCSISYSVDGRRAWAYPHTPRKH